ncbi:MAG: GyrI-like domain-containing protein [Candidatus Cloacimonetes bacterium]|nr:GyrI-like domain-containing protein [Candidatus Cloacimonadota bacterium]MCF7814943.1 GyrI-like domain-containing protein [Candidatus Cloacimonadota bacterium]MCF7867325.1 GyrI-like domain-containing protein [Candidatus Cloacimonadota bacterium]MCF7882759.1 GyrI-like domain-containing protein [Candidatus Cloacimonadota bacterium]
MKMIITRRQPMKVVGMKIITEPDADAVANLWNQFIHRMNELEKTAVPECSLGICTLLKDGKIEYLAARVVKDDSIIPDGMVFTELPEQDVAVFTHVGSMENLAETYDYIYNKWLPDSEFEIMTAPEIEWYDKRFKYNDPESQMDIHIPVKPIDIDTELEDLKQVFQNFKKEER